ncbi:MAG: hypothetical protein BHV59_01900 [Bifidobacterium sp. 56_9_plus]|nr:MAG: hypothetical protein BHV59_01900 [Bifidobacterium sp. 56_9_plus]
MSAELEDIHEECGIFGVWGHPDAARLTYFGLHALQHRGQEGAGIVSNDHGHLIGHRGLGLLTQVFGDEREIGRLTGDKAIFDKIREIDPLFDVLPDKHEYFIDRAVEFMNAGMTDKAVAILKKADAKRPLVNYYLGYLTGDKKYYEKADKCDWSCAFPARLDDIAVLKAANTGMAKYYLGCLYYDRRRYEDAIAMWEAADRELGGFAPACRNLGLAYFDKRGDFTGAEKALQKALDLDNGKNDRIFFEFAQLYKNGGKSVEERLALHEKYAKLSAMRDDCTLDHSILLTELGRYDEAKALLDGHWFHTYEGGEGNLTKQHAWMHVLYANELSAAGKAAEAYQVYMNGVNMPKSYGEAKTWFNQEAHIFYYLGTLLESLGKTKEAANAFEEASVYKAAVSELSMFRALALRKLMRFSQAQQVLTEMLESGDNLLKNKDIRSYYGVGSPTPMPFEYDIVKINSVNGHILRGYALLGLGRRDEAEAEIAQAATYSPNDFRIYTFHQVKNTF